jgi:hypothetical protein
MILKKRFKLLLHSLNYDLKNFDIWNLGIKGPLKRFQNFVFYFINTTFFDYFILLTVNNLNRFF